MDPYLKLWEGPEAGCSPRSFEPIAMPEGPEIQIACDKVAPVVEGHRLNRVQIPWPALQEYEDIWTGRLVKKVEARGKALLFHFDCGDILYTHNQLYGRWLTRKKPELLDPQLTRTKLKNRLLHKRFRNRQLASLYLDQSFLAGPGNYLRSEILFCAGVPPRAKPSQLSVAQVKTLADRTLEISNRAYLTKGYTTEPALAEELKRQGEQRRSRRHYVFGRAGKACRLCDYTIVKVKISSRSVFYCAQCQAL